MKNILFTTDFSKNAENALPYAVDLVKKISGKLYLLHAYELPMVPLEETFSFNSKIEPVENVIYDIRSIAHDTLNQLIRKYQLTELEHRALIREGKVKNEIICEIENNSIDLVVMGTRGENSEHGFLMGSITKHIIQHASSPVFAIPEVARFNKISKIVYLSNLKYDETNILNRLIEFAKIYDASISILHIDYDDDDGIFLNNIGNIVPKKWSVNRLKEFIDKIVYPKITYKEMVNKNIILGINEYIHNDVPNVISMTTYTTTLLDKLFHKSLTKQVLLHTKIPLLAFNGNLF